jgi:hypothetical protein
LDAWEMVCMPSHKGGMEVMNLELQNEALLLKYMDKFMNKANITWLGMI